MRRFIVILMVLLSWGILQAGSSQKQAYDPDLEKCFGEVRADIFRYACKVLDVNDTTLTNKIDVISMDKFKVAARDYGLDDLGKCNKPISGRDCDKDYSNQQSCVDEVCNFLKGQKPLLADDIEVQRNKFHDRLAEVYLEYQAYPLVKEGKLSASKFAELFPDGYYVQNYPDLFGKPVEEQKDMESNKDSEIESNVGGDNEIDEGQGNDTVDTPSEEKPVKEGEKDEKGMSKTAGFVILLVLLCGITCLVLVLKKKKAGKKKEPSTTQPTHQTHSTQPAHLTHSTHSAHQPQPTPTPKTSPMSQTPQTPLITEKHDRNFVYDDNAVSVIGASVVGNSHISMNLPCQDCCGYENLGQGWGIAITSDGAGSAEHSEVGSMIVVSRAIEHFKRLLTSKGWVAQNHVPTEAEWTQTAYNVIKSVYEDLKAFAENKSLPIKSLSATVITVIHTPFGLLTCHVGDGRAGYRNAAGEWKSVITPHKGEEANQTIFLTSDFWNVPNYVMSGVMVPECRVVNEKVTAFTLMSDGCESTSWLYNQQDGSGKFFDPNQPYPKFFEPLANGLKGMHDASIPTNERLEKWGEFLKTGGKFAKEPDDKTMILGIILQ